MKILRSPKAMTAWSLGLRGEGVTIGFVPTIVEHAAQTGNAIEYLDGSRRGWSVHSALREQYPERYDILVGALERVSRNPDCIRALEQQQLATDWYGPDESHAAYLSVFETMQRHAHLFQER